MAQPAYWLKYCGWNRLGATSNEFVLIVIVGFFSVFFVSGLWNLNRIGVLENKSHRLNDSYLLDTS